ncbi:hypothetical protein QTP88_024187 [Uroleucon formosanum]
MNICTDTQSMHRVRLWGKKPNETYTRIILLLCVQYKLKIDNVVCSLSISLVWIIYRKLLIFFYLWLNNWRKFDICHIGRNLIFIFFISCKLSNSDPFYV